MTSSMFHEHRARASLRKSERPPRLQAVDDRHQPGSHLFASNLREHRELFDALESLRPIVEATGMVLARCLERGNKIMLCGNGGSAADCQHIAAELTGRLSQERAPLAAMALTVDSSALTCIANDYGFGDVFQRQVRALGQSGDCLVAISASGRSENVLRAVEAAREIGIVSIALTGETGLLASSCDHAVAVPSTCTERLQEAHIFVGHTWCGLIEEGLGLR